MKYFKLKDVDDAYTTIWALRPDGKERCLNDPDNEFESYKNWTDPEDKNDTPLPKMDSVTEITKDEAFLEMI